MEAVKTPDQLIENLLTLESYRVSRRKRERVFYNGLIRNGICFLIYTLDDRSLFGPCVYGVAVQLQVVRTPVYSERRTLSRGANAVTRKGWIGTTDCCYYRTLTWPSISI